MKTLTQRLNESKKFDKAVADVLNKFISEIDATTDIDKLCKKYERAFSIARKQCNYSEEETADSVKRIHHIGEMVKQCYME